MKHDAEIVIRYKDDSPLIIHCAKTPAGWNYTFTVGSPEYYGETPEEVLKSVATDIVARLKL